jgi:hypothetical protein
VQRRPRGPTPASRNPSEHDAGAAQVGVARVGRDACAIAGTGAWLDSTWHGQEFERLDTMVHVYRGSFPDWDAGFEYLESLLCEKGESAAVRKECRQADNTLFLIFAQEANEHFTPRATEEPRYVGTFRVRV